MVFVLILLRTMEVGLKLRDRWRSPSTLQTHEGPPQKK
jgi:hypothetical protein